MSKTADLRKLITSQLNQTNGTTYHRTAPNDAVEPYKVYTLSRVDLGDLSRDDYTLTVDVWDRANDPRTVEELCDQIEDQLNAANLPQNSILPTIFRESRYPVEEQDKEIQHEQLTFSVQLYTR